MISFSRSQPNDLFGRSVVLFRNTFCSERIALKRAAFPEANPSRLQLGLGSPMILQAGFSTLFRVEFNYPFHKVQ